MQSVRALGRLSCCTSRLLLVCLVIVLLDDRGQRCHVGALFADLWRPLRLGLELEQLCQPLVVLLEKPQCPQRLWVARDLGCVCKLASGKIMLF